ncbi:hypothetical protein R1sor_017660 [Riccia sorocarpa]|uniref:PHD-type zinc finger plants domain-containing protein n=1 Tax=Riccia sorocarpa TaxID=122646 RepID=A0ABD3I7Q9_9MARC
MEKTNRQKLSTGVTGTDEINNSETESRGPGGTGRLTNECNTLRRSGVVEEQLHFKKPRLDSSYVMKMPEIRCEDGSIILKHCDNMQMMSMRTDDDKECSTACVGECSTCGDTGFQSELFRCTKCSVRLQHTYCSNSYNPKKRWFIGLCNWCELDVSRSGGSTTPVATKQATTGTIPTTPTAQTGTNRRDSTSTPCSLESTRGSAAIDCSTSRVSHREGSPLPTTVKSVRCSKLPSFDAIENIAKRSGPSCNGAVKTSSKKSSPSSGGGGEGGSVSSGTTSSDDKLEKSPQGGGGTVAVPAKAVAGVERTTVLGGKESEEGSEEGEEKPLVLKRSCHRPRHVAPKTATNASGGREGTMNSKENSRETSSTSSDSADTNKSSAGRVVSGGGRGESDAKPPSSNTNTKGTSGAFRRSYSMNMITKSKKAATPQQLVDYDDKSETTMDNTVRVMSSGRRSPGGASPKVGVKRERDSPVEEERRAKKEKYCSGSSTPTTTSGGPGADGGQKLKTASIAIQESSTREGGSCISARRVNDQKDRKENNGGGSVRTVGGGVAGSVDRKFAGRVLNVGSNGLEVAEPEQGTVRHGASGRSVIPLRKSQSFRLLQQQHNTEQSRLVNRPNAIIGKSKQSTHTSVEASRTPTRKFADLKNSSSKLRRSSSSPRVSGVHFKCLSDILC